VLRLVAAGRSNAQIGAELFISRATAAVHVTNIMRKLDVTNRMQAAALAERDRLLHSQQPSCPPARSKPRPDRDVAVVLWARTSAHRGWGRAEG